MASYPLTRLEDLPQHLETKPLPKTTVGDVLLVASAIVFITVMVFVGATAKPSAAKPEQPFTLACTDSGCAP